MNIDELTAADRLGLILGALAAFAEGPLDSRKSDLTKALKEYTDAWVRARETRPGEPFTTTVPCRTSTS